MHEAERIDEVAVSAVRSSVDRCLAARNLPPLAQSFANMEEFGAYWSAACEAFRDDHLALDVTAELPLGAFGLMSYAVASAATLGDAFRILGRDHSHRVVPGTRVEVVRSGGRTAELHIRTEPANSPVGEIVAALLALRMRQLPIKPITLIAVGIARPRPRDLVPWKRFFGVVPRFGLATFLRFPASALESPLRTSSPALQQALGTVPGAQGSRICKDIEGYLRTWLREAPTEDDVARAIGLSRRTMQRRLAAEGLTFRGVLRALRVSVAKEILGRAEQSISEVASAVGMAHAGSFSRMFREETGLAPEAWRSRALAQPAQ